MESTSYFRWASGWYSPIYCDNRKILSYPEVRMTVKEAFCERIKSAYPSVELIAGVATGAIAHGVLVADTLGLPFVYVRSSAKEHGLGNRIEGEAGRGSRVVVIEDLISTGKSSINAVEALRDCGCEVLGLAAVFSYNFDVADQNFRKANCPYLTLTNYNHLIELALEKDMLSHSEIKMLKEWQKDPANWKPKKDI